MDLDKEQEIKDLIDQRIEGKKQEWLNEKKEEIKKEARREIRQEIREKVRNEKDKDMSRRQFLKKTGIGAASLGVLSLSPTAANLKLTKNGILGSKSQNQKIQDVETLNITSINTKNRDTSNVVTSMQLGSSQSIGDDTETRINLDTIEKDQLDGVTADTTNNKLIIEEDGSYVVSANLVGEPGSTTRIAVRILLNGSKYISTVYPELSNAVSIPLSSRSADLSQNDELELVVHFLSSSGGGSITGDARTRLEIRRE